MGWAQAHRGTGGRFGRAVAALLRALAAAWAWAVQQFRLFRQRKLGQKPTPATTGAAQPASSTIPQPTAQPAPQQPAQPVAHSPRTPHTTQRRAAMALGMHAAVDQVIDAYDQLAKYQPENLADCRLLMADLPGMFDLAADATGNVCENIMEHAPTADPYDDAMGEFETQLHKVGSMAESGTTGLERWTGDAELRGNTHPALRTVNNALVALANAVHPDLKEARQLAGSLPLMFEAAAQAMGFIVAEIALHAPTANEWNTRTEEARLAFERSQDAAEEANAKLGEWVETPTVV
jgi:hypothetical protein